MKTQSSGVEKVPKHTACLPMRPLCAGSTQQSFRLSYYFAESAFDLDLIRRSQRGERIMRAVRWIEPAGNFQLAWNNHVSAGVSGHLVSGGNERCPELSFVPRSQLPLLPSMHRRKQRVASKVPSLVVRPDMWPDTTGCSARLRAVSSGTMKPTNNNRSSRARQAALPSDGARSIGSLVRRG
jgi:hypothetical protein